MTDLAAPPPVQDVNRPCFVCGADDSTEAYKPDVRKWGHHGDFVLRRCTGCGLVFNSPRLAPPALAELYRRNYYFFDRYPAGELSRIVRAYLRTVALLPGTSGGTLLEVGSAKGYMLALLRGLGWQVTGVELAEEAAAYARRVFGVEVFSGTLERFRRTANRQYDVVLVQDVLEHVPEPGEFLRDLHASLKPGGRLVIDTPNVGARNVELLGSRWRGFNPFHIYLYDRVSLERVLTGAGFSVRTIGTYNNVGITESATRPARSSNRRRRAALLRRAVRAVRAVRGEVEQALVPWYLRRAVSRARVSRPAALDPECRGDNLVCIAARRI